MKRASLAVLMILIYVSFGCSTTKKEWRHSDKNAQQFYRDSAVCETMGNSAGSSQVVAAPSGGGAFADGFMKGQNMAAAGNARRSKKRIFNNCMMGEGWILTETDK